LFHEVVHQCQITCTTALLWFAVRLSVLVCCLLYCLAMVREAEALARKHRFLLCRYALILVTGVIGYMQLSITGSPVPITALVAIGVLSNLYLGTISPFNFFDANMQAPVLVADTAMVSAVLLVARASQEFFLFFFFILIMAAKIENLVLLGVGATLIAVMSLFFADLHAGWVSPIIMRVPFMLATALFYGYVVLPERTGQMTPFGYRKQAAVQVNGAAPSPAPQVRPRINA
jgi:hypothetical protein